MAIRSYKHYIIETVAFGVIALLGLLSWFYFFYRKQYLMSIIFFLIILVALDNFFCGPRAKKCGIHSVSRYIIPPFLRR